MNTLVFLSICRPKYKKSSVKTVVNYAKQREVMNRSELQNTLFIKNDRNGLLAPVLKNLCLLQFCFISAVKLYAESLRSGINNYICQPLEETNP